MTTTNRSFLAYLRVGVLALAGIAVFCAVLAWTIDQHVEIWIVIANVLTFGGHFWPAVASTALIFTGAACSLWAAIQLESSVDAATQKYPGQAVTILEEWRQLKHARAGRLSPPCPAAELVTSIAPVRVRALLGAAVAGGVFYMFAYAAMVGTFESFAALNTYAKAAYIVLSLPYLPTAIFVPILIRVLWRMLRSPDAANGDGEATT